MIAVTRKQATVIDIVCCVIAVIVLVKMATIEAAVGSDWADIIKATCYLEFFSAAFLTPLMFKLVERRHTKFSKIFGQYLITSIKTEKYKL